MPTRAAVRSDSDTPGHSIAVVAARTGLSPDVLRVWERRYAAVAPIRSAGNQRLYSDEDIARFQLLAAATSVGRSIRTVASLSRDALEILVAEDDRATTKGAHAHAPNVDVAALEAAVALTVAQDGAGLDRMLRRAIALNGLPAFLEVDAPALMRRVGDDWEAGRLTVAHEHLASAVVLSILLDAVRSLPTAESAPRLLVATLTSERHAVGAALAAAVAAMEGWVVVHLGVDVPSHDIATAAIASGAHAVALSIVHDADRAHVLREITGIRSVGGLRVPVLVGGATAVAMSASLGAVGATVCPTFSAFRAALAHVSTRTAGGAA
ncbi:MAG: MerR family transcriptional regulator [Gemmatimonadota bacterium]|nr:MerR family transcriptional regulator [Gemmatimonadota bacterium]